MMMDFVTESIGILPGITEFRTNFIAYSACMHLDIKEAFNEAYYDIIIKNISARNCSNFVWSLTS